MKNKSILLALGAIALMSASVSAMTTNTDSYLDTDVGWNDEPTKVKIDETPNFTFTVHTVDMVNATCLVLDIPLFEMEVPSVMGKVINKPAKQLFGTNTKDHYLDCIKQCLRDNQT